MFYVVDIAWYYCSSAKIAGVGDSGLRFTSIGRVERFATLLCQPAELIESGPFFVHETSSVPAAASQPRAYLVFECFR